VDNVEQRLIVHGFAEERHRPEFTGTAPNVPVALVVGKASRIVLGLSSGIPPPRFHTVT
jgi:hypothetical protein